jgi:flagellar assembly factor FliW
MPICQTKYHGPISFEPEQVLQVPGGLFGFTEETQFLLLELASSRPLAFLQSVRSSNLCFLCLPAQVIDSAYTLSLRPDDLERFGYSEVNPPVMGKDVLCLALLTVGDHLAATANLAAPILIDIAKHRGMQVVVTPPYSHQHPLPAPGVCSKC